MNLLPIIVIALLYILLCAFIDRMIVKKYQIRRKDHPLPPEGKKMQNKLLVVLLVIYFVLAFILIFTVETFNLLIVLIPFLLLSGYLLYWVEKKYNEHAQIWRSELGQMACLSIFAIAMLVYIQMS